MPKDKALDPFTPAFTAVKERLPPSLVCTSSSDKIGIGENQNQPQHHDQWPLKKGYHNGSNCEPHIPDSLDGPNKKKRANFLSHQHSPPYIAAESQPHYDYREMHDARSMGLIHVSTLPSTTPPALKEPNGFKAARSTESNRVDKFWIRRRQKGSFTTGQGLVALPVDDGRKSAMKRSLYVSRYLSPTNRAVSDYAKTSLLGNNCTRGEFICEGYASKICWRRNGVIKPPPPLQAKEKMTQHLAAADPKCPTCDRDHRPRFELVRSNTQPYSDLRSFNGCNGTRVRPIAVRDAERNPPSPSGLDDGWNKLPRSSNVEYAASVATQYSQPSAASSDRAPSHYHHNTQPKGPPQPCQHDPRVHHDTCQGMSQTADHTLAIADSHDQTPPAARQPPSMVPPTSAPPATQPAHYTSQTGAHKTEKEKMLIGEPFLPIDELLLVERAHCSGAICNFNSIASYMVIISRSERELIFRRIVEARWVLPPLRMDSQFAVHTRDHLGGNVNVATPFHCDYGYNVSISDNMTIGSHYRLHDSAKIAIGRNSTIGHSVTIQTLKTPTDTKSPKGINGTEIAREVYIGENVYVGDNVIIEAGARIGNNAIIRSGSVVSTASTAQWYLCVWC
jgi:acetyltransferase-like isoleucine patch superfamily enzyme